MMTRQYFFTIDEDGTCSYPPEVREKIDILMAGNKRFTTYTGETIKLCDNCSQFKRDGSWEIRQCNRCARDNNE